MTDARERVHYFYGTAAHFRIQQMAINVQAEHSLNYSLAQRSANVSLTLETK